MIYNIIFSLVFGLLNRERGTGARRLAYPLMAFLSTAMAYYHTDGDIETAKWVFFIVLFGIAAGMAPGWGRWFVVVTGNKEELMKPYERKWHNGWINGLADRVFGTYYLGYSEAKVKLYGLFCFTLRSVYLYPMFVGLSFFNPDALFWGLFVGLMGPIYWLGGWNPDKTRMIASAEVMFGAVLGGLIAASL